MKTNLPRLTQDERDIIDIDPHTVATQWLTRINPPVPWDVLDAGYCDSFFGDVTLLFELCHTDIWGGERVTFRTGTVMVRFSPDGYVIRYRWYNHPLDLSLKNWPIRPLWLWGQFWDAIPLEIKMSDPDYNPDPFDGAADFHPVRNNSSEVL